MFPVGIGTGGMQVDCACMPRTQTIWSYLANGGWTSIETAPHNEDVYLVVTDNTGTPYCLPRPWKLTSHGWVNSELGTLLSVTPIMWRGFYRGQRKKRIYELRRPSRTD